MASSWLIMTASVAFSFSSSVDKMPGAPAALPLSSCCISVDSRPGSYSSWLHDIRCADCKGGDGGGEACEVMEFNKMVKAGEEIDFERVR